MPGADDVVRLRCESAGEKKNYWRVFLCFGVTKYFFSALGKKKPFGRLIAVVWWRAFQSVSSILKNLIKRCNTKTSPSWEETTNSPITSLDFKFWCVGLFPLMDFVYAGLRKLQEAKKGAVWEPPVSFLFFLYKKQLVWHVRLYGCTCENFN